MADITLGSVPKDPNIGLDELILAIANQDQIALQTLYCQYRRSIFAVAYAVTHDHQLSEDVLQNTIIRIWENASSFRQDSSSKAWIHAIARNQSLDIIRQRKRSVSIEAFENQPTPEQLVTRISLDDRMLLVAGLNKLNHDQAIVFVLKAIVGLSHLESAKMLHIPYRLVRYRYHQAILGLRKFLSNPAHNIP
jgi:RNA polymerase sigma-70 factor, ECF subfamily